MCTLHLRSQLLQRAELQLLHRSFAFPKLLRDLPNAPLLNETLENHSPVVGGKFVDQSKQSRTTLDGLLFWAAAGLRRIFHIHRLAGGTLRKIGNSVRRNAVEPGRKRGARPCITFQVSKRLVKNLRSQILRFIAIAHSPRNKRINPLKMSVIQCAELCRVLLRGLHQQTLPRVYPVRFRRRFTRRHAPSVSYNCDRREKVTLLFSDFQPSRPSPAPSPATRLHPFFQSSSTRGTNDPPSRLCAASLEHPGPRRWVATVSSPPAYHASPVEKALESAPSQGVRLVS